jgi:hypothetical protein
MATREAVRLADGRSAEPLDVIHASDMGKFRADNDGAKGLRHRAAARSAHSSATASASKA